MSLPPLASFFYVFRFLNFSLFYICFLPLFHTSLFAFVLSMFLLFLSLSIASFIFPLLLKVNYNPFSFIHSCKFIFLFHLFHISHFLSQPPSLSLFFLFHPSLFLSSCNPSNHSNLTFSPDLFLLVLFLLSSHYLRLHDTFPPSLSSDSYSNPQSPISSTLDPPPTSVSISPLPLLPPLSLHLLTILFPVFIIKQPL